MKTTVLKTTVVAVTLCILAILANATPLQSKMASDTTKMSKMDHKKMSKMDHKKMSKMSKSKMAKKDTTGKM